MDFQIPEVLCFVAMYYIKAMIPFPIRKQSCLTVLYSADLHIYIKSI